MKSPIYPDIDMKQVTKFGIVIDYCPKSGGVWLDKGEIEKLVEYVRSESHKHDQIQEEDNIPFGDSEYKSDKVHTAHGKHKKKRENPIMEIFEGFLGD